MANFIYSNVSTDTTITATAALFGGVQLISKTTGDVTAIIMDAAATAVGTQVISAFVTAGTGNSEMIIMPGDGVICRSGIHVNVTCTSAADQVIVFYSPL